jgi:hypothetical protein
VSLEIDFLKNANNSLTEMDLLNSFKI